MMIWVAIFDKETGIIESSSRINPLKVDNLMGDHPNLGCYVSVGRIDDSKHKIINGKIVDKEM